MSRLAELLRRAAAGPASSLVRKMALVWRRERATGLYQGALNRGDLLVVPPASPGTELLSVLVPVFRVNEAHLNATIDSVRTQTYPHWELLLLDDASPDPHVGPILTAAASGDPRIRILRRLATGGIAVASNELVDAARGRFTAFLDHDDCLHPRALEMVARGIAAWPETDWFYSDEDKLDAREVHREPCFKPAFSLHMLLAWNFVAHLRVVRRDAILAIGGHRPELDGAQDYDLALRLASRGARFTHLPGVLYHWRSVRGSMARRGGAKPAANQRAAAALAQAATAWAGSQVAVELLSPSANLFRVRLSPRQEDVAVLPPSDPATLIAAVRAVDTRFLAVLPHPRDLPLALERLLPRLVVPGSGVLGGRLVRHGRVVRSGWSPMHGGGWCDPWAGLHRASPGYCNQGLLPGPRWLPPLAGWVARRETLLAAWDEGEGTADAWRLATGLARLGLEVATYPDAEFTIDGAAGGLPPEPPELPGQWSHWPWELGLTDGGCRNTTRREGS